MSTEQTKIFYSFPNHGDEDGNNGFTIAYGDPSDDLDDVIVGAEDTEEDAQEACKRLNQIIGDERDRLQSENDTLRQRNAELTEALKKIDALPHETCYDSRDGALISSYNKGLSDCQEISNAALRSDKTSTNSAHSFTEGSDI